MKHIIVTTPKSEMGNAAAEAKQCIEDGGGYYFRKVSRTPKEIVIGESKLYYVEDGYIRGFGVIIAIDKGVETCQTTDREWGDDKSCLIWIPACTWKWVKPVPMKGFQGWRYFDDKDIEVIGEWQDPKPETDKE